MKVCPRCDSKDTRIMVESPIAGEWEMYVCNDCFYSWRSSEDPKVLPKFKLTQETIKNLGVIPPVPPLDADVK